MSVAIDDSVYGPYDGTLPERPLSEEGLAGMLESLFRRHGDEGYKGGPGSGHHGHRGRPGHRGGSVPGSWTAPSQDTSADTAYISKALTLEKEFYTQMLQDDKERGAYLSLDGRVLDQSTGTGTEVILSEPSEVAEYYDIDSLVITHCHPPVLGGALTFSTQDIQAFVSAPELVEERVIDSDGRVHVMRKPLGWDMGASLLTPKARVEMVSQVKREIDRQNAHEYYMRLLRNPTSYEAIEIEYTNLIMPKVIESLGLTYQVEQHPDIGVSD